MNEKLARERALELLYEKYIAPTENKNSDGEFIGVEIEFPIINLAKEAVDFDVVHELTQRFKTEFGFYTTTIDEDKNANSLLNFRTDDILSYDCSYNNLELSFGKEREIAKVAERFAKYYAFIENELAAPDYTLSGLGVNPYRGYNHMLPIPNGRYRMLFHHLSQADAYRNRVPMFFHPWPDYGMFSSASQVQLDVTRGSLIPTVKAFTLLEPLKTILFANSVLTGEREDLLCARDMFWENSTHGINPHNIGMFEKVPETIDELLAYISTTSIYCTEQDGKYINFAPINIVEYFAREKVTGEYYDASNGGYRAIEFAPRSDDIKYLRSFKFIDLTFRGTIEFRSVCCQPVRDAMSVAAFHAGLMSSKSVDRLLGIFENDTALYGHGYNASELRRLLNLHKWPDFIDKNSLRKLLRSVLEVASDGLSARGLGEEKYIDTLKTRAENLTNPARNLLARMNRGETMSSVIKDYASFE